MQVWKHLRKQLHGNRREYQVGDNLTFSSSSSSSSSLHVGGFVKQQTSASVFYVPIDDSDVSVISLTGTQPDSRSCFMEKVSVKDRVRTLTSLAASHVNSDSNSRPVSTDVVKPTLLPKPNKAQKPDHHEQQQQERVADPAVTESRKQYAGLIMCPRHTLYPSSCSAPSAPASAQETTSSVTKPLPPVCSCFYLFSFFFFFILLYGIDLKLLTSARFGSCWNVLLQQFSKASLKDLVTHLLTLLLNF